MSATETKATHTCKCGRTFANEQILKYHQRVSKHGESDAAEGGAVATVSQTLARIAATAAASEEAAAAVVAAPTSDDLAELAYQQAVDVLMAKRAEQEAYERNQAAVRAVGEFVDFAGEIAGQGCRSTARAVANGLVAGRLLANKLLVVMLLLLATGGIITVGMGLGSLVANASGMGVAQAVSPAGVVAQI